MSAGFPHQVTGKLTGVTSSHAAGVPTSLYGARWTVKPTDPLAAEALVSALGIRPLVARLLVQRGITEPEQAHKFLNPSLDDLHDPKLLPDYDAAASAIQGAIERKEKIFIHGDYDVDGVTSASLLTRCLKRLGADVTTHVPHRVKEGYGIHVSAVDRASEIGAKLFLTCDCGSSAITQIERANELGMTVVVTDHHAIQEAVPQAAAFVNPHRTDQPYPFSEISGVGVAFKLCAGLSREKGVPLDKYYRAYLDLVTLGTVADVMPLVDENRIIVSNGLPRVQDSGKPGIRALLRNIDLRGPVTAKTIGFQLGPRLNAAGRLDDAALSLQLLLEEDEHRAQEIADELEAINKHRREEQDRIMAIAHERIAAEGLAEAPVIVLDGDDWHSGIIGLIAGRVVEAYHRPAFVMSTGEIAKGSARTIPGYHLADALKRLKGLLLTQGGHELAAGFSLERTQIPVFREALTADALATIPPEAFIRQRQIDTETTLEECTVENLYHLQRLAPFGQENPEPVFVARRMRVDSVTPTQNPEHVRLKLRDDQGRSVTAMGWRKPEIVNFVRPDDRIDIVFHAEINRYNGTESVQWIVHDLAISERT